MILFPEIIVTLLILFSLLLTGIGAITLVVLLIKDFKNKEIW